MRNQTKEEEEISKKDEEKIGAPFKTYNFLHETSLESKQISQSLFLGSQALREAIQAAEQGEYEKAQDLIRNAIASTKKIRESSNSMLINSIEKSLSESLGSAGRAEFKKVGRNILHEIEEGFNWCWADK